MSQSWDQRCSGGIAAGERIKMESLPGETSAGGSLNLNLLATVYVSSEHPDHPARNAFDGRGGLGGSRWRAEREGQQVFYLAFNAPQQLTAPQLEIEETDEVRTQEVQLAVSRDNGMRYSEVLRQEFNFSPEGATFEREMWRLNVQDATHVRLWIKPDKGGIRGKANITTLALH